MWIGLFLVSGVAGIGVAILRRTVDCAVVGRGRRGRVSCGLGWRCRLGLCCRGIQAHTWSQCLTMADNDATLAA